MPEEEHIVPTFKKASFDFSRFEKPKSKAGSERASLIEPFVIKLNNSRLVGGYKPLGASFYASKMTHIPTDELHAFYRKLEQSPNFSAIWYWHCAPKKKAVEK
jgi:hypothetical protein